MSERAYKLSVRGLRMGLLALPLILMGPILALMFPMIKGQTPEWVAKFGMVCIWAGVGIGAVGILTFLFHRSGVAASERLRMLIDVKPFIWLNLIALGGFLGLLLLTS